MRNITKAIIAILILIEFSCSFERTPDIEIAKTKIENFTIQTGKDTILHTKDGIQIIVNKNSLNSNTESIDLEFSSFIDKASMVSAKLNTLSADSKILESDGMIKIGVQQNVSINKESPIRIKVPSISIASEMKIFKGEFKNEELIWTEPAKLNQNQAITNIEKGKTLFLANCTSCHNKNLIDDMTGPALGNIHLFRDSTFLVDFTRNASRLIASGDRLASCLFSNWNMSVMTSFENMTTDQINQIYDYIESESRNKNIPTTAITYIDSCVTLADTTYLFSGGFLIDSIKSSVLSNQPKQKINTISQNYEFDIREFGWYNIDLFLNSNNSIIDNFEFTIDNNGKGNLYGFAIFKNRNVIIPLENKNGTYFLKYGSNKESIEFPLNEALTIIVFEELEGKVLKVGDIKISSKVKNNSHVIELNDIYEHEVSTYLNILLQ